MGLRILGLRFGVWGLRFGVWGVELGRLGGLGPFKEATRKDAGLF